MLIESYNIEVEVSDHSTEEFEYEAIAHLEVDIREVLPYLNATLTRGVYLPDDPVLSWRHEGSNIGFWSARIAIDHLDSREEVDEKVAWLVKMVNDAWEKRDEIEPDTTSHERRQPLEIHQLLPKTNCKACDESTCFSYALKLAAGQVELSQCTPLVEVKEYEQQKGELEALLEAKWPTL